MASVFCMLSLFVFLAHLKPGWPLFTANQRKWFESGLLHKPAYPCKPSNPTMSFKCNHLLFELAITSTWLKESCWSPSVFPPFPTTPLFSSLPWWRHAKYLYSPPSSAAPPRVAAPLLRPSQLVAARLAAAEARQRGGGGAAGAAGGALDAQDAHQGASGFRFGEETLDWCV